MRASRTPDILADAAHAVFLKDANTFTGNFLIDDTFLFANGVRDFVPGRPRRRSRTGLFRPRRPAAGEHEESGRLISGTFPAPIPLFAQRLRAKV
jgi:hypothetical protein